MFLWLSLWTQPALAAVKSDLGDSFVKMQFDWAMYLRVQPVPSYLNYNGSRLHPLCRVRVYYRVLRDAEGSKENSEPARVYEDHWFYDGKPIGLRRYMPLSIEHTRTGGLFLNSPGTEPAQQQAAASAIVRVIADLHLMNAGISSVVVPEDAFDAIEAGLAHYRFLPQVAAGGQQLNIHLQSSSGTKDGYYFFQK